MSTKLISIELIFLIVLISGCVQQIEKEPVEKTALLSFTELFCTFTETSKPFAYVQFAYQDDGEIKYVKTKTTCKDFDINMAYSERSIFGEKIILDNKNDPTSIKRENGQEYQVEKSEEIRSFFKAPISIYENPKNLPNNSHPNLIVQECKFLKNQEEHDICISYQAGLQKDTNICSDMYLSKNQELCKQWIQNIKEGKVNK